MKTLDDSPCRGYGAASCTAKIAKKNNSAAKNHRVSEKITIFTYGDGRQSLGKKNIKLRLIFCFALNLHYLCSSNLSNLLKIEEVDWHEQMAH